MSVEAIHKLSEADREMLYALPKEIQEIINKLQHLEYWAGYYNGFNDFNDGYEEKETESQ